MSVCVDREVIVIFWDSLICLLKFDHLVAVSREYCWLSRYYGLFRDWLPFFLRENQSASNFILLWQPEICAKLGCTPEYQVQKPYLLRDRFQRVYVNVAHPSLHSAELHELVTTLEVSQELLGIIESAIHQRP